MALPKFPLILAGIRSKGRPYEARRTLSYISRFIYDAKVYVEKQELEVYGRVFAEWGLRAAVVEGRAGAGGQVDKICEDALAMGVNHAVILDDNIRHVKCAVAFFVCLLVVSIGSVGCWASSQRRCGLSLASFRYPYSLLLQVVR